MSDEDEGDDPFADRDDPTTGDSDPFERLDADTEADPGEAFDAVDVDEVPIDEVWAAIEGSADDGATAEPSDAGGDDVAVGVSAESVGDGEHIVPKADYCERCPYLAAPPALACDHDGTTIVAVEDDDHFRVQHCPMVERGGATEE